MSSISHAIFCIEGSNQPACFSQGRLTDTWIVLLLKITRCFPKLHLRSAHSLCYAKYLCFKQKTVTLRGCVLCLFLVKVWATVLQQDWSKTKDAADGLVQELHYLCYKEWEMELKRPNQGLSHLSSTGSYPPMYTTSYSTQNPLWKSKQPPTLCTLLFPTSQPGSLWPGSHSNTEGPLSPSRPITFHCQSAMREASGWQKQSVEKKIKTLWCLHYLAAPRPVSEARVNCCWLDVSTHGWVSLQISLRGPQRERRKGWGRSQTMMWNQCQVFLRGGFCWLGSR